MTDKLSAARGARKGAKGEEGEAIPRALRAVFHSPWPRSLLLASALLLVLLPNLATAAPPKPQAQVDPAVWRALENEGEAEVLVLLRQQANLQGATALATKEARGRYVYERLRAVAEQSQRGLRAMLEARQAEYQPFYIVNAVKVRADGALLQALAARAEVERIVPNPRVQGVPMQSLARARSNEAEQGATLGSIQPNLVRIHADDVWTLGYSGQGIVVAGQDTGYDWDHPALRNQYRGWNGVAADHNYNWHDAIHEDDPLHTLPGNPCGFDSAEPCDDSDHGTHTMGILAGDDGGSLSIGMAPGAQWIGCRNMEQGWGTPATYLECFEFFLAPYPLGGTPAEGVPELAPHVVSNSWTCPPKEGCTAETLEAAVEALHEAGIVVAVAAGNSGPACSSIVHPPAIYKESLSVGAFDHDTDQIASFSARGPVTDEGEVYLKPELAAPGVDILSSVADGGYAYNSGTSMATPHVAGAVALLLSAAPEFAGNVGAIEQILIRSAEAMTSTQGCGGDGPDAVPNNVWGWGIVDALAAVQTAATGGSLRGRVTEAGSGIPVPGAQVTAGLEEWPEIGATLATNATGHYAMPLAAGTYQVTANALGYLSETISHVVVVSGEVTISDLALAPWRRVYLPLVVREP